MDSKTDTHVQRTIKDVFKGCTVLTIAQRLNTALNCNLVLVMENGEVVKFDKPEVLAEKPASAFAMLLPAENKSPITKVPVGVTSTEFRGQGGCMK
ncbi:hypothetical protein MC885_014007 [Smutsia gigantea]|nr:hypothetical protein MC885_014007 [Smutsia gigantea]